MGNSHSSESSKQSSPTSHSKIQRSLEILIDGGRLLPVSHIYPSTPQPESYNREIIQTLILQRRLAPFFRGLDDWESSFKEKDVDQALTEAEEESRKRVEKAVEDAKEELKQREISRAAAARAQANNVAAALAQHNQLLNVLGIQGVSIGSQPLPQSSSIDEASVSQLSTSLSNNLDSSRSSPNPPRSSTDTSHIVSNSAIPQNLSHSQSIGSHQSSSSHPHFGLSSILGGGGSVAGGNSNENHVFHGRRKEKELPLPPVLANPPHHFPFSDLSEVERQSEIALYLPESIECPICFLYTPPLINRSRCCHQPICTECFVQIKRADPSVTNPNSEPACCPYCAVPNFGVTYEPPAALLRIEEDDGVDHKKKKKHSDSRPSDVVYTDQIHPNWEAKLAAVQATIARRANRRIVFRQVGDTLVPVGISSGRVSADSSSDVSNEGRSSRRRNRGVEGIEASLTLEELMINEAIKRSLIEEEERRKKESEERENRKETTEPPGSLPPPLIPSPAPLSPSHSRSASSTFQEVVGSSLNPASIVSPDRSSSFSSISQSETSVSGETVPRTAVQSGLTLSTFGNSPRHSLSSTSLSPPRPSSFSNSFSVADSDRPPLLPSLPSNHSTTSIPTTVSSTFSEGDDPVNSGYQRLEDEELQRTLQD